jgi:hypothetical protein
MKGGFHMSNSSLWIIIALLVIMMVVLIYNSTWTTAAPEQKKENGPSISSPMPSPMPSSVPGPSMPKKEGFRTGEECSKCEAELAKCKNGK